MCGVNLCLVVSLPPAAEEDAGGAGQDSGADAAGTERELLKLPQRSRPGQEVNREHTEEGACTEEMTFSSLFTGFLGTGSVSVDEHKPGQVLHLKNTNSSAAATFKLSQFA